MCKVVLWKNHTIVALFSSLFSRITIIIVTYKVPLVVCQGTILDLELATPSPEPERETKNLNTSVSHKSFMTTTIWVKLVSPYTIQHRVLWQMRKPPQNKNNGQQ